MNRLLALAIALLALGSYCIAQVPTTGAGKGAPGGGGGTPFAIDGTPTSATNSSSSPLSVGTLTTVYSNDIAFATIISNAASITGISGCSLTWAEYPGLTPPSSGGTIVDIWYAKAASPLSGCTVSITMASSAYTTAQLFAVSGAHYAAPFDTNVALPGTNNVGVGATCTTSNANDILIGDGVSSSPTPASGGWTFLGTPANFMFSVYLSVSSPQVATSLGVASASASVCGAIIQGP